MRDEFLGKLPVEAYAANIKVLLNVGLTMSDGRYAVGVIVLYVVLMPAGVGYLFSKILKRYLTCFSRWFVTYLTGSNVDRVRPLSCLCLPIGS